MRQVTGIDWNQTIESTFDQRGTSVSFKEYFAKQYNQNLRRSELPLLKAERRKRDIFLPAELCQMTGLNDRSVGCLSTERTCTDAG